MTRECRLPTVHRRAAIASSSRALLLLVAALAWAFTVHQARCMDAMEAAMWRDMNMSMNGMEPSWTPVDAVLLFVMWSAMMAAMMVPGASPMVTAFATINRRRRERAAPYVPTAIFLAGYVIAWTGFSIDRDRAAMAAAEDRIADDHDAVGVVRISRPRCFSPPASTSSAR